MKTLSQGWIYCRIYQTLQNLITFVEKFLDQLLPTPKNYVVSNWLNSAVLVGTFLLFWWIPVFRTTFSFFKKPCSWTFRVGKTKKAKAFPFSLLNNTTANKTVFFLTKQEVKKCFPLHTQKNKNCKSCANSGMSFGFFQKLLWIFVIFFCWCALFGLKKQRA